jgi:murein DD-endopeptidase MepM/ murein hydrolase activator NlpD
MRNADCGLRNIVQRLSFMLFLLCLSQVGLAETMQQPEIVLEPKHVGPGDIMIVTVKNAAGVVEGALADRKLYFNRIKNYHQAVVGLDLYLEPGTYDLEIKSNGATAHRMVTVSKKKYPLQRLTLPEGMVVLSPENEARAEREQRKMAALWPVDSLRLWSGNFIDPLPGKKVGTIFGVRRIINKIPKSSHSGVDISADEGVPVLAPNDGVAVLTDDQFYSGNCVVLDHGQGIHTMFFHLSKINVRYGQAVMKGDVIGLVGATGRASGPHLHWGVRIQGARVDPLELIRLNLE